jgi:TPR repeat protein
MNIKQQCMNKFLFFLLIALFPLYVFGQSAEECIMKGFNYHKGTNGVTKDYKEAYRWFKLAADKGYARGQCLLGILYFKGDGVAKDYSEAAKWFQKAAEEKSEGQVIDRFLKSMTCPSDFQFPICVRRIHATRQRWHWAKPV